MNARPAAVLFDLDETLTDRSASIAAYAERFCADFSTRCSVLDLDSVASQLIACDGGGYNSDRWRSIVSMSIWLERPEEAEIYRHWQSYLPSCAVGRQGLRETLAALSSAGMELGLLTNGKVMVQEAKIDALGVRSQFTAVVISEAVGVAKPDPEAFRIAAQAVAHPVDSMRVRWRSPRQGCPRRRCGRNDSDLVLWHPAVAENIPSASLRADELADVVDIVVSA